MKLKIVSVRHKFPLPRWEGLGEELLCRTHHVKIIFWVVIFFFLLSSTPSSLFAQQEILQKETEQIDFAQGLLARGLYEMSVSEYQKFIAAYPQSFYLEEANLAIGECYFLAQNFPKGIEAFNHFKELYPNSERLPTALLRLGQMYIQQKQYLQGLP